jgi:hypothetical protein
MLQQKAFGLLLSFVSKPILVVRNKTFATRQARQPRYYGKKSQR